MKNSLEQVEEIIDNLIVICNPENSLPQIEKDILLAKIRQVYSQVMKIQVVDNEEFANNFKAAEPPMMQKVKASTEEVIPVTNTPKKIQEEPKDTPKIDNKPETQQKIEATPAPIVKEDVAVKSDNEEIQSDFDLFFDPDQEEVKASEAMGAHLIKTEIPTETPSEELLADEIAAKMHAPAPKPTADKVAEPEAKQVPINKEPRVAPKAAPAPQPTPKPIVEASKVEAKPDKVIEPEPLTDLESDEDDILQFIPTHQTPKSTQPVKPIHQASVKTAQPTTPLSQTTQSTRSLNDLFNERKEDHSLGTQFQHAKVKDLTKAISINDKFTYIKELFNNHGEEFSDAVHKLNQCTNIEEAFDLLEEFKKHYYWDATSTAYLSLCDLIRRKYA